MKIAVIEDLESDYNQLYNIIQEYFEAHKGDYTIQWFSSGETFLSDFFVGKFDLVFIDMLLGDGINGLEVSEKLRSSSPDIPIVFTTTEREYALQGYEVQAMDYLIKPCTQVRLASVLDRVVERQPSGHFIAIQAGRDSVKVSLEDLVYAEIQGHYIELHLNNGNVYRTYLSFAEFEAMLPKIKSFQVCCRGVIVNLGYVDHIEDGDFILKSGDRIAVSRSNRVAMKHAFTDYVIEKTRGKVIL